MDKSAQAYTLASTVIQGMLSESRAPLTRDMIETAVDKVLPLIANWEKSFTREQLVRRLETTYAVLVGKPVTLEDAGDHKPWLEAKRTTIDWRYWNRYRLLLEQKGRGPSVVGEVDSTTDEILGRLEDPQRAERWDRRGVVVGYVQSGKTANYVGLICKAADAGYKVFIVLAGIHNSLRSQTQMRLDEGFVGYDSKYHLDSSVTPLVGVGAIDPALRPDTITTRMEDGDFSTAVARQFHITPGGNKLLFVVKKNVTVLRNLLEWVQWASNSQTEDGRRVMSGTPLLLIDDEADLASIDYKKMELLEGSTPDPDHDPARINFYVRSLLYAFDQCCYVGYTATPFANIFIWPQAANNSCGEDLFPRSFITVIQPPSDYMSPARVFGLQDAEESEADVDAGGDLSCLLCRIADSGDMDAQDPTGGWIPPKHKSYHTPRYEGRKQVPPSLRNAICAFILAIAARAERGYPREHNSMLVHVTRFVNVQQEVWKQIMEEVQDLRNQIKLGSGAGRNPMEEELRALWETDFQPVTNGLASADCPGIAWDRLKKHIIPAVESIKVKLFNGSAKDALDYYDNREIGLNVIVVGGDKLSRGLTLEGLSISYFLRPSRMYDTLMQMGRWFGYRPGYIDLCRLHTTNELIEWFAHIASADDELRREFNYMASIGQTPLEYGLKVRSHPKLLVTSQVKMRSGTKLVLSFSGALLETTVFFKTLPELKSNSSAAVHLVQRLLDTRSPIERSPGRERVGSSRNWKDGVCFSSVNVDHVVEFFRKYKAHPRAIAIRPELIVDYILKEKSAGRLLDWTVFIPSGDSRRWGGYPTGDISLIKRSWSPAFPRLVQQSMDRLVIKGAFSRSDETIDISRDAYQVALEKTIKAWEGNPGKQKERPSVPSSRQVRAIRPKTHGLLIIYTLDPTILEVNGAETGDPPVMGFVVSFPGDLGTEGVPYVVAQNFWQESDD